ncbi:MAG: hypothetical protein J5J00_16300 [Deltaproteobacteria bacterium]|nr:hypothetical protein [Deltaproteobacteria bacterium]
MTDNFSTRITFDQKYCLVLLVKEILSQLNEVAALRKQKRSAEISLLILREMCSVLRDLEPSLQEAYFEILLSLADKSRSPARHTVSESFVQASVGAKRRFIQSIRMDLVENL